MEAVQHILDAAADARDTDRAGEIGKGVVLRLDGRGQDDPIDPGHGRGTREHVREHRTPHDFLERLPGEPGGAETRLDDGNDAGHGHSCTRRRS